MSWNLAIVCDGCGAEVTDVSVRWRRGGWTGQPDYLFHPYDGTLPAGWGWHDDDDDAGCYCPTCRADDVPGECVDLRESDHYER